MEKVSFYEATYIWIWIIVIKRILTKQNLEVLEEVKKKMTLIIVMEIEEKVFRLRIQKS